MRNPTVLFCLAMTLSAATADPLSHADRETLLENLAKMRDSAEAKVDARYHAAITAYREAMASDEAAAAFYVKCIEKVDFEDKQKKNADFREWKRKEGDNLNNGAFRLALRYQLRWLVTALKASSDKADLPALAAEAQETVDSLIHDLDKLRSQEKLLSQSVTSTVFAKAYEIGALDKANWAFTPTNLEDVYGKIIFPPLRNPGRVEALHAAWIKRIQQEGAKIEAWTGSGTPVSTGNGRKLGQAVAAPAGGGSHSPESERFQTETLPDLEWQMEMDLFRNGDESGAAVRMLAHIQKYITHRNARNWAEQFEALLKPQSAPATPAP